jgi:dolichol-phosphate mannosyltransferase
VKYINLLRNFGQVAAIEAGLDFSTGDAIVVLSSDLQDPVELIVEMIEKWEKGDMIVLAHRKKRSDGYLDKFFSRIFYRFIQLSNPNMPTGGFDFCLFDKAVHEHMISIRYRNRFLQGDLLFFGYDIALIPYERKSTTYGSASLRNLSFKIKYFFDGILNSTAMPIRFMSLLGMIFTFLGFLYSIAIFINWLLGRTPFEGWAPIMIAILIIGGLILIVLGVLGEYIWRIYDELKQMPKYVIRNKELD